MAHIAAHDGVAFPMADLFAPFHFNGPLDDRALAGQRPSEIDAAIALAPELAHDPGMAPQLTTGALVPADAPVDGFVTDAQRAVLSEHAGDLFGAPLLAKQPCHQRHVFDAEARSSSTSSSSCRRVAMRFLGAVLVVVVRPIAPQLAADRAPIAPEQLRDLRLRTAAHKLRGTRVSFLLGELVIRHGCNPFPGRMERQPVSLAPHLFKGCCTYFVNPRRLTQRSTGRAEYVAATWRASARRAG